jgi:TonB-dependent receptor
MKNNKFKLNSILSSMIVAGSLSMVAQAAEPADTSVDQAAKEQIETIVVSGFRGSLSRAMFEKRSATNSKETIMSEDLGKFPDLNLTESLQRVPGVAISREGGEGRQITLRGLGASFTRTTLNGMEVPSSTDGTDSGGGVSSGRAFDFNVFASELFNRIDIQKSTTASMEEGGIAGTVDLYSGKPFDNKGFHAVAFGQAGYNDVTEEVDPRLGFMVSNTFADDTFGALLSVAKSERTVRQEGYGTVRWTTPIADGSGPYDTSNLVMSGATPAACADKDGVDVHPANCLWTPRLPRPDFFGNSQDRLGITASLQWAPTDDLVLTLDGLVSTLDNERTMYNFFEQFRSNFGNVIPTAIEVAENGQQIQAATFDNVKSRIESRQQLSTTDFEQFVLSADYMINDQLTLNAMIGTASSDARSEQYRYNMTSLDSHTVSFDFGDNANVPVVDHGYDVNNVANYDLSDGRLRATDVIRENTTAKLDLEYEAEMVTIKTGFAYNDRTVDYKEEEIQGFPDQASAVGYATNFPFDDFGNGFDGQLNSFIVADFDAIESDLLVKDWVIRGASSWKVQEETTALYLELNSDYELFDMTLRSNFGVRYVETTTNSSGYLTTASGVEEITKENTYKNFLPAMNLALDATDDLVVRLGLTQTMTRPSLNSLNPGAPSFDYINGSVSVGNPDLKPFVSNNFDLGFEWYFAEEAVISAGYFYKDLESDIQRDNESKLVADIYYPFINSDAQYEPSISRNPFTSPYDHSTPVNVDGFEVEGIELVYQQAFTFLPEPFNGLGMVTNYTHVSSDKLVGVSPDSYNFTLYYETDTYGARVSMNSREDYFTSTSGSNGNAEEATTGPSHVDFSAFYHVNDNLTFTLEVVNLTDEYERLYTTGNGDLNLVREYNHTGRQAFLGFRYTM